MSRFVTAWFVFALLAAPAALAQDPLPPPPEPAGANEGVAYLIISLDTSFFHNDEAPDSETIIVPLGIFAANTSVEDATFTPEDIPFVPLPAGVSVEDLVGNPTTIVGTFGILDGDALAEVHLVNGSNVGVENGVEVAIYNATRGMDGDGMTFTDLFRGEDGEALNPTTGEIVSFIAQFADEGVTEDEIADALFATGTSLSQPNDATPTIEAEGDLFPHEDFYCEKCTEQPPPPEPIFQFAFLVAEGGAFDIDLCKQRIDVQIDIMPGGSTNSINLKKKGLLPVAILSTDDFDATTVDPETVELGGVLAVKDAVEDVNDDGIDDVILHFDVQELKAGGFLDVNTTSLTLTGEVSGGGDICVRGSDSVTITPNNKK